MCSVILRQQPAMCSADQTINSLTARKTLVVHELCSCERNLEYDSVIPKSLDGFNK